MATVVDILETRLTLTGVQQWAQGMDKSTASLARWSAITAGAAAVGLKAGNLIGTSYRAAADEQARFATASGNFKGSLPVGELEELSTRLSRLTAVEDSAIAGTIGLLGTYQMLGGQAKQIILPILNATRALEASGKSSEGLAEAVGKAFQGGNITALRRYGVFVDEAAFKSDRLQALIAALQSQGGDAAVKFGASAAGGLQHFENAVSDLQEELGKEFIPAVTSAIRVGTRFIQGISDSGPIVKGLATAVGVGFVAAMALANSGIIATIVQLKLLRQANDAAAASAGRLGAAQAVAGSGGLGGKLGKFGKFLGPLGAGAAVAGGISMVPDQGSNQIAGVKTVLESTAVGAGIGAGIGAAFGGIGAVPGALIGGAIGALGGVATDAMKPKETAAKDPVLAELEKQTKALETMAGGPGKAVDFNRLSVVQQRAIEAYGVVIA